jgi:pantoate--beta-alanine ligase
LHDTAVAIVASPDTVAANIDTGLAALRQAGFVADYLEMRDAADLSPMTALDRPARLLTAASLGRTRLIDNIPVIPR